MSFLKAEWRKLILINYEVSPDLLHPYLPYATQLDLYKGKCLVSLVGFMFINTRLLGIPVPYHINFEEVNLRFYVKRRTEDEIRRGVVFIKEIVPRRAITLVANSVYYENYETMRMRHAWETTRESLTVSYGWQRPGENWHGISVKASHECLDIEAGSDTEFITEHYWGYTKKDRYTTFEYEVRHPRWQHYPVNSFQVNVDFETVYGSGVGFLGSAEPHSVMLAEGSAISVENKSLIVR